MFLDDASFRVENKRRGQRHNAAKLGVHFRGRNRHAVIDPLFLHETLHHSGRDFIRRESHDLQFVRIFLLQLDQVGDFRAARPAPCRPKIQQGDFSAELAGRKRFSIDVLQRKWRNRIGILHEANSANVARRGGRLPRRLAARDQACHPAK